MNIRLAWPLGFDKSAKTKRLAINTPETAQAEDNAVDIGTAHRPFQLATSNMYAQIETDMILCHIPRRSLRRGQAREGDRQGGTARRPSVQTPQKEKQTETEETEKQSPQFAIKRRKRPKLEIR